MSFEQDDLPPLAETVLALADGLPDESDSPGLSLERLSLMTPVELGVRAAPWGGVIVLGSTPTQWTETTILPVWHRLAVILEADDAG